MFLGYAQIAQHKNNVRIHVKFTAQKKLLINELILATESLLSRLISGLILAIFGTADCMLIRTPAECQQIVSDVASAE